MLQAARGALTEHLKVLFRRLLVAVGRLQDLQLLNVGQGMQETLFELLIMS